MMPYILQIKIAIAVLLVVGLFSGGVYVRGVFAEREKLRTERDIAQAQVKMYVDAWQKNAIMQKGMQDEINRLRAESDDYITHVSNDPPPNVPDGGTVDLVIAGIPLMDRFTNYTTYTQGGAR